ncbi:MAG TPA: hypothetical protein VIU86_03295, partial [Gaiellaceae bacterium]
MSTLGVRPDWADVIVENAAVDATARRLIAQLRACEVASVSFCRLLDGWARGDADPCTPGRRQAALRRAAERVETALTCAWAGRLVRDGRMLSVRASHRCDGCLIPHPAVRNAGSIVARPLARAAEGAQLGDVGDAHPLVRQR